MFPRRDEFRMPIDMMSDSQLSREYTRLTGQFHLPPDSSDAGERMGWRLNMEQKVKRARRLNDINKGL
jgi:hypothetical protein